MYNSEEIELKVQGVRSGHFRTERGVKQGAVSSPTLFNLIIDELLDELEHE